MANSKAREINERFFDAYTLFDERLCEKFHVEEDGVKHYLAKMKEAVVEAREALPEWDATFNRLMALRKRYNTLKEGGAAFNDFQGKDEDVVWMQVFTEKLEAEADPLAKYSKLSFTYKTRNKGFWEKVKEFFGK